MWGGAKLSETEEAVLKLGKKHCINVRLDSISNQTKIEKGLTKIRWQSENEENDGRTFEDLENNNFDNKKIDLSTVKATDLKFNRRLFPPKAANHKPETNIQQTKADLEDAFTQYTKKM